MSEECEHERDGQRKEVKMQEHISLCFDLCISPISPSL